MTVPSKEDFEIFLERMSNFNASELLPKYYNEPETILGSMTLVISPTPEAVREMINTVIQVLDRKYKELEQTTVYSWLAQQEAFQRARKASIRVLGNGTQIPDDSEVNSLVERFMESYQLISLDEYKEYTVKYSPKNYTEEEVQKKLEIRNTLKERLRLFDRRINNYLTYQRFEWLYHTVSALNIYYFSDIDTYLVHQREQDNIAKKAKEAIDCYLDVVNIPSSFNLHDKVNYPLFRALKRASLEIEDILEASSFEPKPIQRGGLTARERLLVFNLWKTYRSFSIHLGKKTISHASSITHLLSLEGIDNPIEKRTIEKLIQGWRAQQSRQREMTEEVPQEKKVARRELKKRY